MMEHEDFEQFYWQDKGIWITFCTCGAAFWADDSIVAFDEWEKHEARNA